MASYPPILLNWRLQSVEGISLDFLYLNIVGYVCYTASICMLYFNPFVKEQYSVKYTPAGPESHAPHYPLIKANDVAYTVHGLICAMVVYYQVHFTSYKKSRAQLHLSFYTKVLLIVILAGCGIAVFGVILLPAKLPLTLLDISELLGFVKVCMSTSKYIPQLIYNQQRKSTKGWAINATILDITGGLLSLSQLFADGYANNDIASVLGNFSKLSLALVSMIFDVLFLIQHFILFPNSQPEVISLNDW